MSSMLFFRLEPNTNVQLRFLDNLKTPVYTEKNITAESNEAIRIGIFEGDNMITDGPLSKVKVEIVVLRGDFSNDGRVSWTEEQFNNHIVQGRNGQGFVLGGDCGVWLKKGENRLGKIRFKEGSSRTRSRMFILGARVCKSENTSVRVQEAVMKPVTVLDRRNEGAFFFSIFSGSCFLAVDTHVECRGRNGIHYLKNKSAFSLPGHICLVFCSK